MITIPSAIEELLKSDSVRKNFRVHFPNGEFPDITNDNIVDGSVELSESLCSKSSLQFGSVEGANIRFETVGIGNIINCKIECGIEIYCDEEVEGAIYREDLNHYVYYIPYGVYFVESSEKQSDMTHRKVQAYTPEINVSFDNIDPGYYETLKASWFRAIDQVKINPTTLMHLYFPELITKTSRTQKYSIVNDILIDDEQFFVNNAGLATGYRIEPKVAAYDNSLTDVVQTNEIVGAVEIKGNWDTYYNKLFEFLNELRINFSDRNISYSNTEFLYPEVVYNIPKTYAQCDNTSSANKYSTDATDPIDQKHPIVSCYKQKKQILQTNNIQSLYNIGKYYKPSNPSIVGKGTIYYGDYIQDIKDYISYTEQESLYSIKPFAKCIIPLTMQCETDMIDDTRSDICYRTDAIVYGNNIHILRFYSELETSSVGYVIHVSVERFTDHKIYTGTFSSTSQTDKRRVIKSLVFNNKIYLLLGEFDDSIIEDFAWSSRVYEITLNDSDNTITITSKNTPSNLYACGMVSSDDYLYVLGFYKQSGNIYPKIIRFDTNISNSLVITPPSEYYSDLTFRFDDGVFINSKLYFIGHFRNAANTSWSTACKFVSYDETNDSWNDLTPASSTSSMNAYKNSSRLVCTNNIIYVIGGNSNSIITRTSYKELKSYNISRNRWSSLSDLPYNFYNGGAVLYNNTIYIFGISYEIPSAVQMSDDEKKRLAKIYRIYDTSQGWLSDHTISFDGSEYIPSYDYGEETISSNIFSVPLSRTIVNQAVRRQSTFVAATETAHAQIRRTEYLINEEEDLENIDIGSILTAYMEAIGRFGHFDRYGNFIALSINDHFDNGGNAGILLPSQYSSLWYGDVLSKPIGRIQCTYRILITPEDPTIEPFEDQGFTWYDVVENFNYKDYKVYDITNNYFIKNNIYTDESEVLPILISIAQNINKVQFMAMTLEAKGMPHVEVGDVYTVNLADGTSFPALVMQRSLKGIHSLRDSIKSNDDNGSEASSSASGISSGSGGIYITPTGGGGVTSVNGKTGDVVLTAEDIPGSGGGDAVWGQIVGTLSNQTDLQNALNGKANVGDIPTVNNGVLTIQRNGVNVQTFSANQSGNASANILVPTFAYTEATKNLTIT